MTHKNVIELVENVKDWGFNKGIITKSSPLKQHVKTQEEVNELLLALLDGNKVEAKDAIGDVMVTLILQCELNNFDIFECLEGAYNVISKRTGKMIDGIFVKDKEFSNG